ncbi:hypothetical protein SDC9_204652 [bioreactor metagenome]|uniref:Uncharacterized protein n=1 Tax=bioreactor metagenome TaxID=1076179 RepID=A0A645IZW0_9ZZZZ
MFSFGNFLAGCLQLGGRFLQGAVEGVPTLLNFCLAIGDFFARSLQLGAAVGLSLRIIDLPLGALGAGVIQLRLGIIQLDFCRLGLFGKGIFTLGELGTGVIQLCLGIRTNLVNVFLCARIPKGLEALAKILHGHGVFIAKGAYARLCSGG